MGPRAARLRFVSLITPGLLALGVLAAAQAPLVRPRIVEPINEANRTVLKGNTHRLARPQFDRGVAPADLPMSRMLLVLKRSPEQDRALRQLLDDQQDKASPNYHKWLTPGQFGKRFGPAEQDIATVKSWLQSHGFEIGNVAKGGNLIEFSGVARQVQQAFHTSIHKYVVNGEEHWANANDPEIPSALTPVVAGVHTLHNFLKKPMLHMSEQKVQGQLVMGKDGKPYVTFGPPPVHALGPADFATIYNVNPLYEATPPIDGTGITIAVVARTQIYGYGQDVFDFRGIFGMVGGGVNFVLNGTDPGNLGGGEEAEAILDASWAAAAAPNASVQVVISATTNTTDGVDLSEAYIVDNNIGSIMTESFGSCEASATAAEAEGISRLAEQAAAQGITYFVASGDAGAEGCDNPNFEAVATGPLSVNILSSTPFNVAVGGTVFNENGQDNTYWNSSNDPTTLGSARSYIPENVWNESCLAADCGNDANIWAAGGGASAFFAKPSWQSGVTGIPNDAARDVPDVSLTAAFHDPYLICLEGSCVPDNQGFIYLYFVSCTSASAPSFAGIMALVNQKMGGPQGQAGYVLYKLAAGEDLSKCNGSNTSAPPISSCIFNDTTVGNNAVPGESDYGNPNAKYQAGAGYDLATGLGSVNVTNLVNKWDSASFRASTSTITNLSPTSITHGQPVDITVSVAAASGSGTPTGDISLITSNNRSLGFFTLNAGTVSTTTSSLPGGTYTIMAHYAGDGTFSPSTSDPSAQITVDPEPSTATLTAQTLDENLNLIPFTTGTYGTYVFLQSTVQGLSHQGVPTGSLTFYDDSGYITDYRYLNNQGIASTPNYLNSQIGSTPLGLFNIPTGQRVMDASYQGDPGFYPSNAPPLALTITQAPTTITATAAGDSQGAYLSALINTNSGGNSPSGSVTFYINGNSVGDAGASHWSDAIVGANYALIGVQSSTDYFNAPLANGSYTVKAVYNGDQNYLASTSPEVKFTLQPDFRFEADTDTITVVPGRSGNLTLTLTALDRYNGTVAFDSSSCEGLPDGVACSFSPTSIKGSGASTLTVTTTGPSAAMPRDGRFLWWATIDGFGLAGVVIMGIPLRRRRLWLVALVVCILLMTWAGCGGGSSAPAKPPAPPPANPTPAGNYTITVKAASGSIQHSITFTLDVT